MGHGGPGADLRHRGRQRRRVLHAQGETFRIAEPPTCESCATYNMLKLTRHLFCWDPKAAYMDYYERAWFNQVLAGINPKDGMTCCFLPLAPGSRRVYCTPLWLVLVLHGHGLETFSKHCESIYFHDGGKGLYVALFVAAEDLYWKARASSFDSRRVFPTRRAPTSFSRNASNRSS